MNLDEIISATRSRAALFERDDRGLLEVRGEDRVRWLDGMISGDMQGLVDAGSGGRSGCYALLLTNRGAIVADLHVGRIGESFVLESRRDQIPKIREALDRFIIADDVTLVDLCADLVVLAIEGPRAGEVVSKAVGVEIELGAEDWAEFEIAARRVRIGTFGVTGETAYQLHLAVEDRAAIVSALEAAGRDVGMVSGDAAALEVMRVEAGIPALGSELNEEVLPAEARLERAISTSKGCYVGQEIVARLRSRGQVNHLLVGFRIEGDVRPAMDTPLMVGTRRIGEITSVADSPEFGSIALGFVRREHSEVGSEVEFEGGVARVAALPFSTRATPAEPL
jgi:folate-binding protein YgfZ